MSEKLTRAALSKVFFVVLDELDPQQRAAALAAFRLLAGERTPKAARAKALEAVAPIHERVAELLAECQTMHGQYLDQLETEAQPRQPVTA